VPALLYGLFACYAVTGKCDLRIDSEGRDLAVFASLADCQRFGTTSAGGPPDAQGKWIVDAGHYYRCFGLTPVSVAALTPPAEASRAVYKTTAEALQRDFRTNPDALTHKIGGAILEVSGTVTEPATSDGTSLQLSGDTWDVTAWLTNDGIKDAIGIRKHEHVTLRCDRIGTLISATARRAGVVDLRDCQSVKPGT
jgi:hypothetical protein